MGTTTTDRSRRNEAARHSEVDEDVFGIDDDLTKEKPIEEVEQERILATMMSSLHLLLMLEAPRFPLTRGVTVNFKVDGPQGVIEDFEKIMFEGREYSSLSSAARVAIGRQTADGWNQTFVTHPIDNLRPPLSALKLFHEFWRTLDVSIDILTDHDALATYLFKNGKISGDVLERYTKKAKKES